MALWVDCLGFMTEQQFTKLSLNVMISYAFCNAHSCNEGFFWTTCAHYISYLVNLMYFPSRWKELPVFSKSNLFCCLWSSWCISNPATFEIKQDFVCSLNTLKCSSIFKSHMRIWNAFSSPTDRFCLMIAVVSKWVLAFLFSLWWSNYFC